MPSEFDRLVAELQIEDLLKPLSPAQRDGFMKAISATAYGVRRDEQRVLEAAFQKAQAAPLLGDDADDDGIVAAAKEGQQRSDVEARAVDGKPQRKKRAPVPMAKARPAPVSGSQLAALTAEMQAAAARMDATFRSTHQQIIRGRAQENARGVLAKAMAAFSAGRITAVQVAAIEARVHAIDAMAARMESSR